jgi:hypothetical protein
MSQLKAAVVTKNTLAHIPIGVTVEYYSTVNQVLDELSLNNNPNLIILDSGDLYKQNYTQLFDDLHIANAVICCFKKYMPENIGPKVAVVFDNSANIRQIKSTIARDDVNAILGSDDLDHLSEIFLSLKN